MCGTLLFGLGITLGNLTTTETGLNNDCRFMDVIRLKHLYDTVLIPIMDEYGQNNLIITSCFRSAPVNGAVGGTEHSYHMTGEACDFTINGQDIEDVHNWVRDNIAIDNIILYKEKNFIHITKKFE